VIGRLLRLLKLYLSTRPDLLYFSIAFSGWLSALLSAARPDVVPEFSSNRPAILFVDSSTPRSDRDAGAVSSVQFMRLFAEHGWDVFLWPFDQVDRSELRLRLAEQGIVVIVGSLGSQGFLAWYRRIGKHFQVVFLSRPAIAATLLPVVRTANPKIAYYGHDLHFVRFEQEFMLTRHRELRWLAQRFRCLERAISREVDVCYYPSMEEVDILQSLEPAARIRELPPYAFDFDCLSVPSPPAQPAFLFVGNFGHLPNRDAVQWLLEDIWPSIRQQVQGAQLTIVGADPPAPLLKSARTSADITWTGWVSDLQLSDLYRSSRIALVPLRFGAGVKHKVVAAVVQGCAVVTTETGLQGLPELVGKVGHADTPEQIALECAQLILSDELWNTRVQAARQALSARFTPAAMWQALHDLHLSA